MFNSNQVFSIILAHSRTWPTGHGSGKVDNLHVIVGVVREMAQAAPDTKNQGRARH